MEDQNGGIKEYKINITEVETGRTLHRMTPTTSITISSLRPYYNYTCYVAAYTIDSGPYSNISLQMPEDGKCPQVMICN